MMRALAAEFAKLKRARMLLWTSLVIIGYTSIGLAVFPIVEKMSGQPATTGPDAAGQVFAQAGITTIDWPTAMRFIPMGASGAWGVMLLSLIAAYVFGRELREGTDVTTATLPLRREAVVAAKMVVIAAWVAALCALAVVADVAVVAFYLGVDGFTLAPVLKAFGQTLYACLPIYLGLPIVGWLSRSRKGYLRPMLFAFVTFSVAMSLVGLDAAAYTPWSMPTVLTGVTWMPLAGDVTWVSWVIALGVFVVGMFLLLRQSVRAEAVA